MQQQINLYQPLSSKREEPFSASTMVILFAITLVLMMGFYGMLYWKKMNLESEVSTLKELNAKNQVAVEKLEATVRSLTDAKKEQQQLAYLKRVHLSKESALDELSSLVRGNSNGVSEYFSALARKDTEAIWFDDINVYSGGEQIFLKGQTTDARVIPQFMSSLKNEPVFQGVSFKLFQAQKQKDQRSLLFSVQTETQLSDVKPSQ